jgi:hypothetical protein
MEDATESRHPALNAMTPRSGVCPDHLCANRAEQLSGGKRLVAAELFRRL